jgi:outer membrane immunogenic protein
MVFDFQSQPFALLVTANRAFWIGIEKMHQMRLAFLGLLALTLPAAASDLAARDVEPIAPVPSFNWTGPYLGISGGYAPGGSADRAKFGTPRVENNPMLEPLVSGFAGSAANFQGGMIGGQVGYNYQFANNLVVGAELGAGFTNITGSYQVSAGGLPVAKANLKIHWLGLALAHVGYAYDRWLFYVGAGPAIANLGIGINGSLPGLPIVFPDHRETQFGGAAVLGAEYAVTDHWIVTGELGYLDLAAKDYRLSGQFGPMPVVISSKGQGEGPFGRVGLNYKF